jgi:hypothetical protein
MYSRLGKNFITQRYVSPGRSVRKTILKARQPRQARGSGYLVLAPGADEAKLPDQVVEGGPEIVGYIPDEDSDSADGIFRDGCCRPEYMARPVARCFMPLLGSRLPKTLQRVEKRRVDATLSAMVPGSVVSVVESWSDRWPQRRRLRQLLRRAASEGE